MYVKGACYAARERTEEKLLGTYLYVGNALGAEPCEHGNAGPGGKKELYSC